MTVLAACGVATALFMPLFTLATKPLAEWEQHVQPHISRPDQRFEHRALGPALSEYGALLLLSASFSLSAVFVHAVLLCAPLPGQRRSSLARCCSDRSCAERALAAAAGAACFLGYGLLLLAGRATGHSAAEMIAHGHPLVGAVAGMLMFEEHANDSRRTHVLVRTAYGLFILGITATGASLVDDEP
jgi:hypothetical protein